MYKWQKSILFKQYRRMYTHIIYHYIIHYLIRYIYITMLYKFEIIVYIGTYIQVLMIFFK